MNALALNLAADLALARPRPRLDFHLDFILEEWASEKRTSLGACRRNYRR